MEPEETRTHVRENITVVDTGEREGRGGGTLLAVALLAIVLVALFFLFGRDMISGAGRGADVKVDVETPKIDLPKEIKVEVPDEIKVDTSGNDKGG